MRRVHLESTESFVALSRQAAINSGEKSSICNSMPLRQLYFFSDLIEFIRRDCSRSGSKDNCLREINASEFVSGRI